MLPAPFTACPVDYTGPAGQLLDQCVAAVGNGGTIRLGAMTFTLTPGTDIQGGLGTLADGTSGFISSTLTPTISTSAISIPGGLLGIPYVDRLVPGVTDLGAKLEVIGKPTMSISSTAVDLTLPVDVRFVNLLLGSACRIGSPAHPIALHLTSGLTTPPGGSGVPSISGLLGDLVHPALGTDVLEYRGLTLVDNTVTVPGASGCGPLGLLNGFIDQRVSLPALVGASAASLSFDLFLVALPLVGSVAGYLPGL